MWLRKPLLDGTSSLLVRDESAPLWRDEWLSPNSPSAFVLRPFVFETQFDSCKESEKVNSFFFCHGFTGTTTIYDCNNDYWFRAKSSYDFRCFEWGDTSGNNVLGDRDAIAFA